MTGTAQYKTAPADNYTVWMDSSPGGYWAWVVKHPVRGALGSGIEHMAKRFALAVAVKPVPPGALYRVVTNHRRYGPLERKPAADVTSVVTTPTLESK